jgi:hypothetical protein
MIGHVDDIRIVRVHGDAHNGGVMQSQVGTLQYTATAAAAAAAATVTFVSVVVRRAHPTANGTAPHDGG